MCRHIISLFPSRAHTSSFTLSMRMKKRDDENRVYDEYLEIGMKKKGYVGVCVHTHLLSHSLPLVSPFEVNRYAHPSSSTRMDGKREGKNRVYDEYLEIDMKREHMR